jgi:outer membrane lipoprotein-sorting protein
MIEKKPDSFSDIVDRAVEELRLTPVPPGPPPELLEALLQAAKENEGAAQRSVKASAGGPDSLSIGTAGSQEVTGAEFNASCVFGPPIGKLSGPPAPAEIIHHNLLNRSLTKWRYIMRSPVSQVAAAVIFILAIVGVAALFHSGGATPAFADFVKPLLEAKTAKYKTNTEIKGPPAMTITSEVMVLDANKSRQEMESPNMGKGVMIFDWGRGKSLTLDPKSKKAMVVSTTNMSREQILKQDMVAQFRSILSDVQDKPDVKRESLGEKEIDGRRVVGFRVNTNGTDLSVWGDPKTGLPVRAEITMAMYPGVKTTMTDFEFNVDLDESLFSVEPPPGYTVENQKIDVSPAGEKDLIETLRIYSEMSGGAFPESLDMQQMMQKVGMMIGKKCAIQAIREKLSSGNKKLSEEQIRKVEEMMDKFLEWQYNPEKQPNKEEMSKFEEEMRKTAGLQESMQELAGGKEKLSEEEIHKAAQDAAKKNAEAGMKEFMKVQVPLQRGLIFVSTFPSEADYHYAGKGVSLGAAEKPIFWYRPKDAKQGRVIYADLSVKDVPLDQLPPDPEAKKSEK